MLVGLGIAVSVNGFTLVDLQALPRWSVCLLTGCALAICAVGCGSSTHNQAPITDGAHCIPPGLHKLLTEFQPQRVLSNLNPNG